MNKIRPVSIRSTLLLSMVCFAFLLQSFSTRADDVKENPFLDYCPKDILLYLEAKNIRESVERAKQLSIFNFATNPEVSKFVNGIIDSRSQDSTRDIGDIKSIVKILNPVWGFLERGFDGGAILCVPDSEEETPETGLIVAGKIKKGQLEYASKFMEVFPDVAKEVTRQFGDKRVIRFEVSEADIDGIKVRMMKRRYDAVEKESLCYAIVGNYAVLTVGKKTIESVIYRFKGMELPTILENKDFITQYEQIKRKELFWYINNDRVIANILNTFKSTGAEIPAGFKALTLLGLETCAGGTTFKEDEIWDDISSMFTDERKAKSLGFMEDTKCHFSATKLMPESAVLYYTFPFPLTKIYKHLQEEDPEFLKPLATLEETLNISVENDLIPRLGKELEFCFCMEGYLPESLWSLRIKSNPADIGLFLQAMPYIYPDFIVESEFEGHKMYLIKRADLATFALAQAVMVYEDKLLVGSIAMLQDAVLGVEHKLSEYGQFMLSKSIVDDKTNGFVFLNTKRALVLIKAFLLRALTRSLAGKDFNPALIPSDDILNESTIPFSAMISVSDNRMHFTSKGLLNVSAFFALASIRLIRRNFDTVGYRKRVRGRKKAQPNAEQVE